MLISFGLLVQAVCWFNNYIFSCTQVKCIRVDGVSSSPPLVTQGMSQGSALGPLHFIIYLNNPNIYNASYHIYVDVTVLYCSDPSLHHAHTELQLGFCTIQHNLSKLKLVLNITKTKLLTFSRVKTSKSHDLPQWVTILSGAEIE